MKKSITYFHENGIEDLKEFQNVKTLKYKDRKESANAVAKFFRKMNPKTVEDYNQFYEKCDDYVYENVYCNAETSCKERIKKIVSVLKKYRCSTVLEIGAGVGSYALALENEGFKVTVTPSPEYVFKFLKWRLKKYKSKIKTSVHSNTRYDCCMFIDVIEHVVDPYAFLSYVSKISDLMIFTQGFKVHRKDMGGYPQHFDESMSRIRRYLETSLGYQKQTIKLPFPPHVYKYAKIKT